MSIVLQHNFDPVDALVIILLTVVLFAIIVLARPQALYPPDKWKENPAAAPDARNALWALIVFIFCIGGGWAMKFAGLGWHQVFYGDSSLSSILHALR